MVAAQPDLARSPAAKSEPADELAGRDLQDRCQELLSELPEREQEVVRLKFLHELSYKEIAEVTGLTAGNVGYILHHALLKLRRGLETPASTD